MLAIALAACGGGGGGGSASSGGGVGGGGTPPATYAVSTSASTGVTVSPTTLSVQQGQTGQLTVTLQAGYQNLSVSGCNGTLNGSTYTVAPTADCTVTATAGQIIVYAVSTSAGSGVTISPTTLQVEQGKTGQLAVRVQPGYRDPVVSGCNGTPSGSIYTVAPTADCTVAASASTNPNPVGYIVETVAGNGSPNLGDGGQATQATLVQPERVLASASGKLYIADTNDNRVAVVDTAGVISTFAGRVSAENQPLGDDGPATEAVVRFPHSLYETANGLYIGDQSYTVRRVDAAGVIHNAAITDRAAFILPYGINVDDQGRIYIADPGTPHHRVLRAELNGTLTVIAGTGVAGTSGDGGQGSAAQLSSPRELHFDGQGNLLIGSWSAPLRQVNLSTGVITTRLSNVMGYFDIDSNGAFVTARYNQVFRIHPTTGVETVIAGAAAAGFSGDGGPATSALFNGVHGVSIDAAGDIFIADTGNNRVRKITTAGVVTTVAGGGPTPVQLTGVPDSEGVGFDSAGNLYFTDFQYHYLRRVLPGGTTKVVAGTGVQATSGDGGPAKDAAFANPSMIFFDKFGRLFFLDLGYGTGSVRMIEPGADGLVDGAADETITTIAGGNVDRAQADAGAADGGPARNAVFNAARDFVFDSKGDLIIADWLDNRIRKVTPGADGRFNGGADEIITTIAGTGAAGQTGDGGLATAAHMEAPLRLAIDKADNLYVFVGNNTPLTGIRRIDAATGVITTVIPPAPQGLLVLGMVMDHAGNLIYADGSQQVVRIDTATGVRTVIAGKAARGFAGDGGDALQALFRGPSYLTVDASDNVYVVDNGNFRIRRLVKQN